MDLPLKRLLALFGLLNVDKPAGVTSRQVVDRVVPLVKPAKAGHAGTLDPLATGVLVVCLGRATRLVPYVQRMQKNYRARFLLGYRSNTDDVEGELERVRDAPGVSPDDVAALLPDFVGRISQVPPQFSAVKVGGERAYRLARQGKSVAIAPKQVDVYRLELIDASPQEFTLEIECGSGVYVRSLGRDLGERLGCGAVMASLTRTAIGTFTLSGAVSPEKLTRESLPSMLLPPSFAVADLPQITLAPDHCAALRHGRALPLAAGSPSLHLGQEVALFDATGSLAGIAERQAGQLQPRQVFVD